MCIKFNYDLWQLSFYEIAMNSLNLNKKKINMCILVLKVVIIIIIIIITYVYVHVSVHVVVCMLWHCEGDPPHLNRAIWEQGKNYYHEIR